MIYSQCRWFSIFLHQRVIQSSARGSLSFYIYSQSVLYLRAHDCSEIFPVIGYAIIIPIIICGCSAFQITEKLSSTSCLSKYSHFFPIFSINAFDYSNFFLHSNNLIFFGCQTTADTKLKSMVLRSMTKCKRTTNHDSVSCRGWWAVAWKRATFSEVIAALNRCSNKLFKNWIQWRLLGQRVLLKNYFLQK